MRFWLSRIALILVLVAGSAWWGTARAEEPLTEAQFRDRYIEQLAIIAPDIKVTIVSDTELALVRPKGEESKQFLGNAYRNYRADPEALDDILQRFARAAATPDRFKGLTSTTAIVLVRPADFVAGYEDAMLSEPTRKSPKAARLVRRPLPGGLVAVLAGDAPDAYLYLPEETVIEALGPVDQAWRSALSNTPGLIGEAKADELAAGLALLTTEKGAASSLLVLDDFWNKTAATDLGAPVVLVASRDAILLTFEDHEEGMVAIKRLARSLTEDSGEFEEPPLSASLLVWRSGAWSVLSDYPYR
jgi:hypothetical protein